MEDTQTGAFADVVQDVGGRIEELHLPFEMASGTKLRQILASHDGNASAIRANAHYYGEMLAPWANRINEGNY